MECGKLRHKIVIEQKSVTVDSYGEETPTWEEYDTTNAAVRDLRGTELFIASQWSAERFAEFTMRWTKKRDSMDEEMRINFNDKTWNILFIKNVDYRNEVLKVTAASGLRD